MNFRYLLYICLCGSLWACKNNDPEPTQAELDEVAIMAHLDSLPDNDPAKLAQRATSGIYSFPVVVGPASVGDILTIRYTLSVMGGALLEELRAPDSILVHRNAGAIYPVGIDMALSTVSAGDQWGFFIPSELALGAYELGGLLPANAILEFRVEVLETHTQAQRDALEDDLMEDFIQTNRLDTGANRIQYLASGLGTWYQREGVIGGRQIVSGDTVGITYDLISFQDGRRIDVIGDAGRLRVVIDQTGLFLGLTAGLKAMTFGESGYLIVPSRAGYHGSVGFVPTYLPDQLGSELVADGVVPTYALSVKPFEILRVQQLRPTLAP